LCCVERIAARMASGDPSGRDTTGKLSTTLSTASMMGVLAGAGSARKAGNSCSTFARKAACLDGEPALGGLHMQKRVVGLD